MHNDTYTFNWYLLFKHPFPRRMFKIQIGRSPDLRIIGLLLLPMLKNTVDNRNIPTRLQWRDRVGFSPTSLLVLNVMNLHLRNLFVCYSIIRSSAIIVE